MVKNSPANAGNMGFIPGSGGSPGEGSGNPLQYSCLGNHMDREAWWATVHGVANNHGVVRQQLTTSIHYAVNIKIINAYFIFFFHRKFLKSAIHCTLSSHFCLN